MRRRLLLGVVTLAVPALLYACADDAVVPGPKPTDDATVIVPESGGDALPDDAADAADAPDAGDAGDAAGDGDGDADADADAD